jgi:hypothetical protein
VPVEFEPVEALLSGLAAAEVDHPALVGTPRRLLDEEKPRVAELRQLVAEVRLEGFREETPSEHVAIPKTAIFDENPPVDAARCRPEGLGGRVRDVCTELSLRCYSHWRNGTHVRRTLQSVFGTVLI